MASDTGVAAAAASPTGGGVVYSALVSSIYDGFGPVVNVIIDKTALNIDKIGISGNTALMWAAFFGKTAIVEGMFYSLEFFVI